MLPARFPSERALLVCEFGTEMSGNKPVEPSPESVARAERRRLAQEEGVQAMADAERHAVEVRRNMQRLRALREAREADKEAHKEAAEGGGRASPQQPAKKRRGRRVVR